MSWVIQNNQLINTENTVETASPMSETLPAGVWSISENTLKTGILPDDMQTGAFCYAKNLRKVTIPESVSFIGEYAFRNTALTDVRISIDCKYYSTSFPDRCVVEFYPYEPNFVTVDDEEIQTADSLMFFAKEEDDEV